MKKKKDFDCVKFKNKIQKEIAEEFQNVDDFQKYHIIFQRIKDNNHLSKFLKSDTLNNKS